MSNVSAETVTRKTVLISGVGVGTKDNREQAQVAFFGVIIKIHYKNFRRVLISDKNNVRK